MIGLFVYFCVKTYNNVKENSPIQSALHAYLCDG